MQLRGVFIPPRPRGAHWFSPTRHCHGWSAPSSLTMWGPSPQGDVLCAGHWDALPGNLVSFAPMYQYERCQMDRASGSALCNVIECGGAA